LVAELDLAKMLATMDKKVTTPFRATYTDRGSTIPANVTLEQMPPDQLLKWQNTELLFNGKDAYRCVTEPAVSCDNYGGFGANPLQTLTNVLSADAYVSAIKSWQKVVTEGGSGYSLSLSPRTFAGQPSECISWKYQGSGIEYCVSAGGVLSYVRVSGTSTRSTYSVVLKSYSTKVSASDFSLPK
jgi:hypothetical protein